MPMKKNGSITDLLGDGFNAISTTISTSTRNMTFNTNRDSGSMTTAMAKPFTDLVESSISTLGTMGASGINTLSTTMSVVASSKPKPTSLGPSTELSLDEFHDYLSQTLSNEVDADALLPLYQCLELENLQDTLNEMEQALLSLLKSHSSCLAATIVARLHTYLGLLYMEQNNNSSAVDAFMRAIWFQSRTPEDAFAIAQANHRLGLAYARKKEYDQATELLDRAIAGYETSSNYYVMAKEDRHAIQEAQQLQLLTKNSRYTIRPDMEDTVVQNQRVSRRRRNNRGGGNNSASTSPARTGSGSNKQTPARQRSFGTLTDVIKQTMGGGGGGGGEGAALLRQVTAPARSRSQQDPPRRPGLVRQSTAPALALAARSHTSREAASSNMKKTALMRQSTSPIPKRQNRLI